MISMCAVHTACFVVWNNSATFRRKFIAGLSANFYGTNLTKLKREAGGHVHLAIARDLFAESGPAAHVRRQVALRLLAKKETGHCEVRRPDLVKTKPAGFSLLVSAHYFEIGLGRLISTYITR